MNVSICIATYGEPVWAEMAETRALPSAAQQPAEEVLVDHFASGTIASARNELARCSRGNWLCFLDADDELAPGYLDAMRREYEQKGTGGSSLLLTPAVSYVRKGRPAPPKFNDEGIPLTADNWLVIGTLIERELFFQVGGFSDYPHGFEDWSLWAKAWKAGAEIVKVKRAVYIAHVNPDSAHRRAWRNRKWQETMHKKVAAELFPQT